MPTLIVCKHKGKQDCVNRGGRANDKCVALSSCDFFDRNGRPKECPFYKKGVPLLNPKADLDSEE